MGSQIRDGITKFEAYWKYLASITSGYANGPSEDGDNGWTIEIYFTDGLRSLDLEIFTGKAPVFMAKTS